MPVPASALREMNKRPVLVAAHIVPEFPLLRATAATREDGGAGPVAVQRRYQIPRLASVSSAQRFPISAQCRRGPAGAGLVSEHQVERKAASPPLSRVRQMCCSPRNIEPLTTGSEMIGT